MQQLNWENLWEKIYEERGKIEYRDPGIEYWDKRAEDFSESRKTNDYEYGREVIKALHEIINSNSEVLDIGAGPGTFVIPFAKKVKKVTAVEPSKGMCEKIGKNAEEEGVRNFEIINKVWQEVDISKITGKYDLVICSIVLWIFKDVWEQLKRMEQSSRGYCCVVTGTGDWNGEEQKLWHKVMGDVKKPSYSEYPLIYNLLYSKGRFPNVDIIYYTSERSVENEIMHKKLFFEKYREVTSEIEQMIRDYVLTKAEGEKYREKGRAAVIWWNVQEKGEEIQ
ncbi:class I SAM-dependent methyltransferase [Desulfallas sp. Bu1-1]|uniref:class I SAM-dependent methyltransferase n=1 Tax=Desulfallas sp. Bu1-1 TaxID=2787620 RepID=UPI00189E5005|nr:class I SAM-dependent methyltransferase [Desulfallas sp. Bu1-1]MBF7082454.1 class I SAM-dependent methyltransferase [Desulfallas sp. Bu1-1]